MEQSKVTKNELMFVVKEYFGGHPYQRALELVNSLNDTYEYTLNDLLVIVPDKHLDLRLESGERINADVLSTKAFSCEDIVDKGLVPHLYVEDCCHAYTLVRACRGEIFEICSACGERFRLKLNKSVDKMGNIIVNDDENARTGWYPEERRFPSFKTTCPKCGDVSFIPAARLPNWMPLASITYDDYRAALEQLKSIPTSVFCENGINVSGLEIIGDVLYSQTKDNPDVKFDINEVKQVKGQIEDDILSFGEKYHIKRDIVLVFKIALLTKIHKGLFRCDVCNRTSDAFATMEIHVHDDTTYCLFKCTSCGSYHGWSIWGFISRDAWINKSNGW